MSVHLSLKEWRDMLGDLRQVFETIAKMIANLSS